MRTCERSLRTLLKLLIAGLAGIAFIAGLGAGHSESNGQPFARPAKQAPAGSCRASSAPAPQGSLLLGVHANLQGLSGRSRCLQARLARATRVQSLREDLSWARAEPAPGRFDWRRFDGVMITAARQGLSVLPVLDDTPRWAGDQPTRIPTRPASYALFAAAAAARYGPGGSFWRAHPRYAALALGWLELWNEPYIRNFAAGGPDPAIYAGLVRAAVLAARATNGRTKFLIEAETTYTAHDGTGRSWVGDMYAAVPDLNRFFDAIAVHPYSKKPPVTAPTPGAGEVTRRVEEIHASFAARGAGAKPLWATEIGWPTCQRDGCVTETQQASYLGSFLELARTTWSSFLVAAYIYDLSDYGSRGSSRDGSFGLLRGDLSRKPSWAVLRATR